MENVNKNTENKIENKKENTYKYCMFCRREIKDNNYSVISERHGMYVCHNCAKKQSQGVFF